jgi:PAS domain S-box-containing protein
LKTLSLSDRDHETFSDLRSKAEQAFREIPKAGSPYKNQDLEMLVQELQIHQIELEMQNDELRIVNELLEQQQMKFSSLYDLAPVGYLILNETGYVAEINKAGIALLGSEKFRVIDRNFLDYVLPNCLERFTHFKQLLISTRHKQNCRLTMIAKTGKKIEVQIEGIIIGRLAQPVQFYLAIIDITERLDTEQNVIEIKERLELALEAAAAGTWELDLDSMEFYLDEFNLKLCNLVDTQFDGQYQNFINLIHPDDRFRVDQHFRSSLNHETKIDVECRLFTSDVELCYASIRGHVLSAPGKGKRFVGIMMNITAKKQLELEAEKQQTAHQTNIVVVTLRAEENERKRISSALHDGVSQLLYGVKMKLDLLGKANDSHHLDAANNLLDMAVKETRNISFELAPAILSDFGLPATIEELGSRLSEPQMKIKTSVIGFHDRLDLVLETTIFRIVQELVNNCMKHAGAGLITIELRKNKNIEIKVKDNGRGFDVAQQQQHRGGKTSSGLISIKNRLLLYDGTLQIDSAPEKGTTVKICLKQKLPL